MNDNEIIKALECCKNPIPTCNDCPMGQGELCFDYLKDYAIDLINRQKAKIKELEAEIDKQYEQAKADVLGNMADGGTSCHWCIAQHRAEAIKEFADRLKLYLFIERGGISTVSDKDIDNIVKEMTQQ